MTYDDWKIFRDTATIVASIIAIAVSVYSWKTSSNDSQRAIAIASEALSASGPIVTVDDCHTDYAAPPPDALVFPAKGRGNYYVDDQDRTGYAPSHVQYFTCSVSNAGDRAAKQLSISVHYTLLPWSDKHIESRDLNNRHFAEFRIRALPSKEHKSIWFYDDSDFVLTYFSDAKLTYFDPADPTRSMNTAIRSHEGTLCPPNMYSESSPRAQNIQCEAWPE